MRKGIPFVLAAAALLVSAMPALAQNATVVLTCERTAGYVNGTVTFYPSLFDRSQSFAIGASCGPDSISGLKTERLAKIAVPFTTTFAQYAYTQESANGTGGGFIDATLPLRNEPIGDNAAVTIAKLTIRG